MKLRSSNLSSMAGFRPCVPLSGTTNLALCPTVRQQISPCGPPSNSKSRPVPHCQAHQTSLHTPLSGTANIALCLTVRHSKSRPVPHWQAQQTSPCAPLSALQTWPHALLSGSKPLPVPHFQTANLALCPTVRQQIAPHCQAQQTSPCAPLSDTTNLTPAPLSSTANPTLCNSVSNDA